MDEVASPTPPPSTAVEAGCPDFHSKKVPIRLTVPVFAGQVDAQGNVDLGRVPAAVNTALAVHFPPELGVDIIAEPGRWVFMSSSHG
jgi:hypothetical protein